MAHGLPFWLQDAEENLRVLVYPPRAKTRPQPITVMLHGMCDEPANECPYFAEAVTERGWLICPRARGKCPNGAPIWEYRRRDETVAHSIQLVHRRLPNLIDEGAGRTLIGFSLGAIFGMDLAQRSQEYPRVLLIGAKVYPFAHQMRSSAIQRVLLAAGRWDMMYGDMKKKARSIGKFGIPAGFLDLGKIGHWFPPDMTEHLRRALAWLHGAKQPRSSTRAIRQEP